LSSSLVLMEAGVRRFLRRLSICETPATPHSNSYSLQSLSFSTSVPSLPPPSHTLVNFPLSGHIALVRCVVQRSATDTVYGHAHFFY
jgi:hypothetical protein